MIRRFLEGFEQRVGGADGQAIRFIDQADFSLADEGTVYDLVFDVTNLFNLDLRRCELTVRLDEKKVRMRAGLDLLT